MFFAILPHKKDCTNDSQYQGIRTRHILKENDTMFLQYAVYCKFMAMDRYSVLKVSFLWVVEFPQFVLEISLTLPYCSTNSLIQRLRS
jgi:hypothetical protein